jgi:glutamate--cysteine ligase
MKNEIHELIMNKKKLVDEWFAEKRVGYPFPFYTSVDIRDSGYKIAGVDANVYPAGFNNICEVDQENSPEIISSHIKRRYGSSVKKIIVFTEEHTGNPYYWENIWSLLNMIKGAGYDVRLSVPRSVPDIVEVQSVSGKTLKVYPAQFENNKVWVDKDFHPDLIISNNDFSVMPDCSLQMVQDIPINPPLGLGWYQRKKSTHFMHYNDLAKEFAQLLEVDPWSLQIRTEAHEGFDITSEDSRNNLAKAIDAMVEKVGQEYESRGIDKKPMVFIKSDSGTYGMGVAKASSGEEFLSWNAKARKKLRVTKGGRKIEDVILQEGIPSVIYSETEIAEPVIYLVGSELVGGFLRAHSKKGESDSLNSPGAVFKRLCISDLKVDVGGSLMENVYGWVAKLASLAIGREAKSMGVEYSNYNM